MSSSDDTYTKNEKQKLYKKKLTKQRTNRYRENRHHSSDSSPTKSLSPVPCAKVPQLDTNFQNEPEPIHTMLTHENNDLSASEDLEYRYDDFFQNEIDFFQLNGIFLFF